MSKQQRKLPSIKEFVAYLNQTVDILDQNNNEEDFKNPNSNVYKLFSMLLSAYANSEPEPQNTSSEEKLSRILYKKKDSESISKKFDFIDHGPIIYNSNIKTNKTKSKPKSISKLSDIMLKQSGSDSIDNTDDIDNKINAMIKKLS